MGGNEDVPEVGQVSQEDLGHSRVVAAHVIDDLCFGGDDAFGEWLLH